MPDIADVAWSERDDHNTEAVPNGWPTGAFPAYSDLVGQMMMGATKRFWNKINPVYQTSGTGDNYIVQTEVGIDQINLYELLCVRIDRSNTTTTPTLQFGATNSRVIVKAGASGYVPLAAGDMYAGNSHTFWYNGAFYVLADPAIIVGGTVQPYSPNLTSWAAITRPIAFDSYVATGQSLPIAGSTSGTTLLNATAIASGTITIPAGNDTLVGRASVDTFTGAKTFNTGTALFAGSVSGTTNVSASATASGTLTLPAATDIIVGRATTDTLTNKTISGASNTITNVPISTGISGLGTGAATALGVNVGTSGSFVVNGGALGTPASGMATNLTGLPLTTGITGTLGLGNGGTGATAANAARLNLVAPTYAAYASIPGLSTTNDKSVICTDENLGYAGTFNWVGSSLTSKTVLQSQTTTSIAGNVITLAGHNLSTGAGILTTTAVNGLSTQTVYWVINLSSSTFSLATTVENAINSVVLTLTGTTNFTFQQLLDPLQDIYVIPTGSDLAGSNGAWVRAGGQTNSGAFRGNYNRMNDRLLIGTGATSWMGDHSGTTSTSGVGSWLYDEVPAGATQRMSYLLSNATLAVVPNYTAQSQYAITGAARTPDGTTSRSAIGVAGYGSGHSTSGTSVAWGLYGEGRKVAGATSTVQGAEIEISNANSTPVAATLAPNWTYVQGQTMGLFLGSGGGNTAGVYDADYALLMTNNGAKFRTGIVIGSGALTQDAVTNYQHAILLPSKGRIEWFDSTNNTAAVLTIHSAIADTTHQQQWVMDNTGWTIYNSAGQPTWVSSYVASSVNYLNYQPGATGVPPIMVAAGTDTNIDLLLQGKGTGGLILRDGAGTAKIKLNTTGIGFFNATPAAKPTVTGSKGANAALTSLLTSLATLGILTDSST